MGLRRYRRLLLLAAACAASPVWADGLLDWSIEKPTVALGDWNANLGANLSGAVYADRQDGDVSKSGMQSFVVVTPSLWRTFAGGWEVGAKSSFLLWHDKLSGDNYGNDVTELAYLYVQSPYGRVEIGQQNGTAYSQAVGVPVVDGPAAINDANVTFFKDPATGFAFNGVFNLRTGVFSSANDAKVNYISPRFVGFQISASFTPYQTKAVLPWTMTGHHVADRVENIWEGNLNYTAQLNDAWSAQASASFSHADDAARAPGHDDVWDWGAGVEADYNLDADNKLSFGAAYRASNAYTFNVQQAFDRGTTDNFDIGGMWTRGPWIAGVEYETGRADAIPGAPTLREWGWNPSVAYVANANLQLTLGWQTMHFDEDSGVFYNSKPHVGMNAVYLHANFQI